MLALDDLCRQLKDTILEAIEMERSVHRRLTAKLLLTTAFNIYTERLKLDKYCKIKEKMELRWASSKKELRFAAEFSARPVQP
ncbi:hypothetical protein KSP40_PGU017891 [Platanthera guangdongensis]|uniref:Uncharacterized protein n=1 Tax=Platanthera guangdongensis TaxID=2320717 RepID=A0ABR2MRR8_9ASPA